jgi:AcrR family transcriptional regulator
VEQRAAGEVPRVTRAEQAERTRRELLDTALRLFTERGYDGTSLQMIADAMGLTKAAVYYYFRTKGEILEAMAAPVLEALDRALDEAAALPQTSDRLQRLADGIAATLVGNPAVMFVLEDPGAYAVLEARLPGATDRYRDRTVVLLFGEHPTLDQRIAALAVEAVAGILPRLAGTPEPELRAALSRLFVRMTSL